MGRLWIFFVYIVFWTEVFCADEPECSENEVCVKGSQCRMDGDVLIFPCHTTSNLICCPILNFKNASATIVETRKPSPFPTDCGRDSLHDKITGGKIASIGQFPWMALVGYTQRGINFTQFLCGGTVISECYILSAAHCINIDRRLKLTTIRLGEFNLATDIDCENAEGNENEQFCADPYVDIAVNRTIPHKDFNNKTFKNDIALIRLKDKIKFTDFIQPICLPFDLNTKTKVLTNLKLTVSGWGKTDSGNLGGSTTLQYTKVTVWDLKRCNRTVPPEVRPINNTQICANGKKTEDACKGDSGGPLVNVTLIGSEFRYFQLGVVSFASIQICGNAELPTIYTRVDNYLDWITNNVDD